MQVKPWDGRKFCNKCGRPDRNSWSCPKCGNNEWSLNENPTYYGWLERLRNGEITKTSN